MSIIHLKEAKVIFDLDQLCYLKIEDSCDSDTAHTIIAKFLNVNNPIEIYHGNEKECNNVFALLCIKIEEIEARRGL
jgi:hypothetical protein